MIPTTASTSTNVIQTLSSAMLGIASIILEGRSVSDDDFVLHDRSYNGVSHFQRLKEKLEQLRRSSPNENMNSNQISLTSNLNDCLQVHSNFENVNNSVIGTRDTFFEDIIYEDKPLLSLQSLVTTTICSTPRSVLDTRFWSNPRHVDFKSTSNESSLFENDICVNNLKTNILSKSSPKQGPHCEQFLRKIGILKNIDSNIEYEEHICDTSVVNEICYHWRIHCLEIDTITSRNEPICIEVYLGPESDAILLEQWIIEYKNKSNHPLMNLSSLCTAIRSQLYFSQITAWSDSIRKNDKELHDTGRFKYTNYCKRKPRLDIFYRIKPYDYSSIDYFKSNPIIHNFPHVIINDNYSLSVSLKSLPRMQNIPMVNVNKSFCWTKMFSRNKTLRNETNTKECNCGNDECIKFCNHNCISTDDEADEMIFCDPLSNNNVIAHREKQVLKYKRLVRKRDNAKRKSESICGMENNQIQNLTELGSINSIRPPLYQSISTNIPQPVRRVDMISIGTQTTFNNTSCDSCGNKMSFLCLNCDKTINNDLEKISKPKPSEDSSTNQADLLLNAIQRTPNKSRILKENKTKKSHTSKSVKKTSESDCVICKRQKTQHIYQHTENIGKLSNDCLVNSEQNCSLNCDECVHCSSRMTERTQVFNEKFHPSPETQFKTPKNDFMSYNMLNKSKDSPTNFTPDVCPKNNKIIPKMNLTEIFCNSSIDLKKISPSPLPIKISNYNSISKNDIPMQKSTSAPSIASGTPSLSYRFMKQSSNYQFKRVRHSSERSDRSSICSDDLFSDDDVDLIGHGVCNIDVTIFKNRFGLRPLLNNLEESLLQRRIAPKKYVNGFKILLGASGGYCPPQVTIPAAGFFYELNDGILNTPYVCEVLLPRKGYKIPSKGNIQVTLLNPEGTVVRMFVICYDLQDMPPSHQTFIRQRILAGIDKEKHHFNYTFNNKCMKYLRYSIHLRFQTSKSGRLYLHTDVRILISRKTDCDTAAAHAKGDIESPKELTIITVLPENPKYSACQVNFDKS